MSQRMMLNKIFRLGSTTTSMQDVIVILTQIREQIGDRITIKDLQASSIFLS
jgi:hypothetical protein